MQCRACEHKKPSDKYGWCPDEKGERYKSGPNKGQLKPDSKYWGVTNLDEVHQYRNAAAFIEVEIENDCSCHGNYTLRPRLFACPICGTITAKND